MTAGGGAVAGTRSGSTVNVRDGPSSEPVRARGPRCALTVLPNVFDHLVHSRYPVQDPR